ncbi:MAG: hypothetical protein U5N10_01725 [Gemmobacter sp.]|nr:hypothetical protein [Gemmobacter sp.]
MDAPQDSPLSPASGRHTGGTGPELLAALASLGWLGALALWFMLAPEGGGPLADIPALTAAVLPLVLIWGAAITLRSVRDLRAEAQRLHAAVEALRAAPVVAPIAAPFSGAAERKPEDSGQAAPRPVETAAASFTSRRDATLSVASADRKAALVAAPRPGPAEDQPALALGTPAEDLRAPLSVADFVRALQFPESPDDKDGFRALRLALEDRAVAKLIRAAQDVLTLLSQEGIYMDDLRPDRARPELWRSFANGERGRAISGLGGIRDRSSLALASGRMREDPIFRDAAHHFLRTFDRTFAEFEKNATDAELVDLADTRTARAFMLVGRVAGVFD